MLYGFIDDKFRPAISASFDEAGYFTKGVVPVLQNKKWGMMNKKGKYCLKPELYDHRPFKNENGLITAECAGIYYIFKSNGCLLKKCKYDILFYYKDDTAVFSIDNKYGLIDAKARVILPPTHDDLRDISEGLRPFKRDKLWGFMNNYGDVVIGPRFKESGDFYEGVCIMAQSTGKNARYGFINKGGDYIIQPVYSGLRPFAEDLAVAELDMKVGFIDRTGKYIVPNEYQDAGDFCNGIAAVRRGGISHFQAMNKILGRMDNAFDEIKRSIDRIVQMEEAKNKEEEREKINRDLPEGCFTGTDCAVVPEKTDNARNVPATEEMQLTAEDKSGLWGHIDRANKIIVPIEYKDVGAFHLGMAYVTDGEAYGYYDSSGKIKIPLIFEGAGHFNDGLARAKIDGLWGFINRKGKWLAKPVYQEVKDFDNGLALVRLNGKWGMIDTKGKEVVPPEYDYLENYSEGMAKMGYN